MNSLLLLLLTPAWLMLYPEPDLLLHLQIHVPAGECIAGRNKTCDHKNQSTQATMNHDLMNVILDNQTFRIGRIYHTIFQNVLRQAALYSSEDISGKSRWDFNFLS